MPWPSSTDYNEAVQSPEQCFSDPDLRQGKPALNPMGLPWPRSGNNADVYKIVGPNGKTWAVKCFTREVHNLRERYQAVSDHLGQHKLPFMVRFQYLEQGIRIHGEWFPAVKMRWVEGLTLNDLIKQFIDRPQIIDRLAQLWLRLAQEMRAGQIVHGDLQHDNVLLVPRKNLVKLRLRLIDYDGMIVPALANRPTGELGHRNYQHPQRLRDGGFHGEADRFPMLVIYTAFRCLVCGGRPLWDRYDSGDNLLFRDKDFKDPARSAVFKELLDAKDANVRALVSHLLLASQAPVDRVPLLHELGTTGIVPALTAPQRDRIQAIMAGNNGQAVPPAPAVTVTLIEEKEPLPSGSSKDSAAAPIIVPTVAIRRTGGLLLRAGSALGRGVVAWGQGRPRSLGAAASVMLLVILLAVVAGVVARTMRTPAGPPIPPPEPPPPPVVLMPRMNTVVGLPLDVGDNMVNLPVERHGSSKPIDVTINNLPEGVSVKPATIPPDATAAILELSATLAAVGTEGPVELVLRIGNDTIDRQTVTLAVRKPTVSSIIFSPNELSLLAGEKESIQVIVRRGAYQGPIDLVLTGMPQGLSCDAVTIPARQNMANLELKTHPNTPIWTGRLTGVGYAGNYELCNWRMSAAVHRPPPGMRLIPIPGITLKSGDKQVVKVTVERRGYRGPIEVRLDRLPRGVTCKPVTIVGSDGLASLEVIAEPRAQEGEKQIELTMAVGGVAFDQQVIPLKLLKGRTVPASDNELQR